MTEPDPFEPITYSTREEVRPDGTRVIVPYLDDESRARLFAELEGVTELCTCRTCPMHGYAGEAE